MSNRTNVLVGPAAPVERTPRARLSPQGKARLNDVLIGAALPIFIVALWQLAGDAGLISTFFLPTPLTIAGAFRDLAASGELLRHLGISFQRAIAGFALGGGLGLAFGLLTGLFRKLEKLLDPSLQMLRLVPHLAIAPLFILWFGFGETSKILIVAKGAFFPLYVHTFLGVRSVDNKLFEVSKVLAFSKFKQIIRLLVPAAVPNIMLGVRLSLAISWVGLVVAELIGSQSGVGFLINEAKISSTTAVIFVGIVIFAIVGKLIDSFVRLFERRLLKWRDSYLGS